MEISRDLLLRVGSTWLERTDDDPMAGRFS